MRSPDQEKVVLNCCQSSESKNFESKYFIKIFNKTKKQLKTKYLILLTIIFCISQDEPNKVIKHLKILTKLLKLAWKKTKVTLRVKTKDNTCLKYILLNV